MSRRASRGEFPARFLIVALLFAIPFLAFPAAASADGSIEVLQVGWDGTVVPGTWSPVRVRVTGGADAVARVEVVLKGRYQPGPQAQPIEFPIGAYGVEMPLAAGVDKEVTVWIPADEAYGGNLAGAVRLMAGDRLLAEQAVEFQSAKNPYWGLVGILAESPSIARTVSQVELPMQGLPIPLSVARLAAADLPPSAERLKALSALVVQGNAATMLTGEQRRAVQGWVSAGGHLLLAGGPNAARAAAVLPDGALPVSFVGADAAADLGALTRWTGVRGSPITDGPIARFQPRAGSLLAGTSDRPLAWRLGLGQGTITLLAADPALEPLATWAGAPALMQKALEPALPSGDENEKMRYISRYEADSAMRLQGAVEALPPEAFPGWQIVALILGGFALVVGPIAHLLLWRTDRREWVWLLVPAGALIVSVVLYYVGIGREGRDVLGNVVAHVRLNPEGGQGQQTLVAGFYSPTHPGLTVSVPGDAPVRVGARVQAPIYSSVASSPMPASEEPPYRVVSGRDTRVEFTSNQWAMRSVAVEQTLGREVGGITAHLGLDGGLIRGTVRNDTPYLLEDAAVMVATSLAKLGSLAPGQTVQVVLEPGPAMDPFGGYQPLAYRLFGQRVDDQARGGMISYASSRVMAVPAPMPPPVSAAVRQGASASTPTPATAASPTPTSASAPTPAPTASPTPTVASTPTLVPTGVSGSSSLPMPAPPPGMPPERFELPQDPEVQRRVRLMEAVTSRPQYGPGQPTMPFTFIAFTRAPVGTDVPSAGNHPMYYLTLLEQPLTLQLPPGRFVMPPALIPGEVVSQTSRGMGGGSNGTVSWMELYGGTVTYGFRPPLSTGAKAEALLITTQQIGSATAATPGKGVPPPGPNMDPIPAEPGVFSLYNWQTASWDPLPGGEVQTRVEPAAAYVGPDGQVKLQVGAEGDQAVRFVLPELAVEGSVAE